MKGMTFRPCAAFRSVGGAYGTCGDWCGSRLTASLPPAPLCLPLHAHTGTLAGRGPAGGRHMKSASRRGADWRKLPPLPPLSPQFRPTGQNARIGVDSQGVRAAGFHTPQTGPPLHDNAGVT